MPVITAHDSYHSHPDDFLKKDDVIAVVGASNDKHKRGFRIFEKLLLKGFRPIPIYSEEIPLSMQSVLGIPCFPNIRTVRPVPHIIIITETDPEKTINYLREMRDNGIKRVWLDGDAFDEDCLAFCKEFRLDYHYHTDILSLLEAMKD